MSLIPYSSRDQETQSIVLRHQQTLVLYDPKSHQLALRDLSPAPRAIEALCPYCQRPLPGDRTTGEGSNISPNEEQGFVDPGYFRVLESTIRAASHESIPTHQHVPVSPNRRRLFNNAQVEDINDQDEQDGVESIAESSAASSSHGISSNAFSPGYYERFFVTEGELGKGGNGVVLLVRHVLDGVNLGHFACKRVPVGDNHQWLEKILNEVQTLQQLSHMNLVSYRHVWLESVKLAKFGPCVPCVFILQQYCNVGDLFHYILRPTTTTKEDLKERMRRRSRGQPDLLFNTNNYRHLPFEQILPFFRDIASGLSHLHSKGFIHRDLKPQNCLLNDTGVGPYPRVLLSDFGEVRMENATRTSTGATGTISYCAPEVLQREPGGAYKNFTTKSDVFSLGMTLYFMCFGRLPYEYSDQLHEENEDLDKLRAEISRWDGIVENERLRPDLPDRLYKSLERLLSPDPSKRPTAGEILLGINVGINDDMIPMQRSQSPVKSGPPGDEYQSLGFRRISPVADTPPPASPRGKSPKRRAGYSTFTDSLTSNSLNQARPSKPSKLRSLTSDSEQSSSSSASKASPYSSLILRPRPESQSLRLARSEFPLMLPPVTFRSRILSIIRLPECIFTFKLAVFLCKIALVTRPCSPLAANSWVYYPLLGLAALDFAFSSPQTTVILALVHMFLAFTLSLVGALCLY